MRRLAYLLIGLLMLTGLACTTSNTQEQPAKRPAEIKREGLSASYEACLSEGGTESYCQCITDRYSLAIPAAWFVGTEEFKPEWREQADAACAPTPMPSPTPAPFSVDEWDPYTPIPEGISDDDWAAAYEKWSVVYEANTLPWREASDRVERAWYSGDPAALMSYCQYWNDLQGRIWTPRMIQLAEVGYMPSHPRVMDCRNMALSIFVPGAKVADFISDAP